MVGSVFVFTPPRTPPPNTNTVVGVDPSHVFKMFKRVPNTANTANTVGH